MGYISAVYDVFTSAKIKGFASIGSNVDMHLARRSGTYAVIGLDGGIDPYGFNALPAQSRDLTWTFREYFNKKGITNDTHHISVDAARDALMVATGNGNPVRLEYTTSSGTKRYVNAKAKDFPHVVDINGDFAMDFRQTFEMADPFWSELFPANVTAWGSFTWNDGTVWGGAPFTMNANAALPTTYTADFTGATAFDLPKITVAGPYGGSLGFLVQNTSLQIYAASGPTIVAFQYMEPLLTGESVTIDSASVDVQKTLASGATVNAFDKLFWPAYQRYIFVMDPRTINGVGNNTIVFTNQGTSPTTGGKGLVNYTKRYW